MLSLSKHPLRLVTGAAPAPFDRLRASGFGNSAQDALDLNLTKVPTPSSLILSLSKDASHPPLILSLSKDASQAP